MPRRAQRETLAPVGSDQANEALMPSLDEKVWALPRESLEATARNHAIVAHCSLNDRDIAELRPQDRIVIP